ncbi:threonine synthase [Mucilaginibacter robiniae]|uniref:Threonine synthase n=1 Tax=Mucilaginibacter robiniae TaxID=2728022 RepID=A0A7L5E168_9SPHI|nr:threonine synthase [Mucilaginibacter robiniae]QJD96781.1 threonine synthase [Mucilaginibacter robiniae]
MLEKDTDTIDVQQPTGSLFTHLQCPECGATYDTSSLHNTCTNEDKSTLFAQYDLSGGLTKDILKGRPANMWRYKEFLPVMDAANMITMGEGFSPMLPLQNLQQVAGDNEVFIKNEANNPTGSFKARGISMAVSRAKELGVKAIVIPTAGNAGGALSAYAARAGVKAIVYMPKLTPDLFKNECRLYGAELHEIDGSIADCGRISTEQAQVEGWFQIATLREPYRVEGKKTMGYEIAEQLNWELPDVVMYPTGGGTGLIGIWKAFDELEALGWIGSKRPRMVAVQSESCNGLVKAIQGNQTTAEFTDGGFTIANGLRVPKSYGDKIILQILRKSNGTAVSVPDALMNEGVLEIARHEGLLIAPEGGALWQAFKQLKALGWVKPQEKVVMLNTGSGYKYMENITF